MIDSFSSSSGAASRGHTIVGRAIDRIRGHFRHVQTVNRLSGLSDHMLRDIGLTRSDIAALRRKL